MGFTGSDSQRGLWSHRGEGVRIGRREGRRVKRMVQRCLMRTGVMMKSRRVEGGGGGRRRGGYGTAIKQERVL